MRDIPINRIMTTSPVTVGPDYLATAAKKLLESGDIHHLPVVDHDKLVGIISSSDLLKLYLLDADEASVSNTTVREVMVADPVVLESDANLRDAATKLSAGGYHALPVVDPDRTLVGIVTSSDLISHLRHQIPSGDGSIQPRTNAESKVDLSDSEILAVLREAKQAAASDGSESEMAQVLLFLQSRNCLLEDACKAAELYIRSGHGEHEHAVLVKRLSDLQERVRGRNL
jgi:CBS domain-containing protein